MSEGIRVSALIRPRMVSGALRNSLAVDVIAVSALQAAILTESRSIFQNTSWASFGCLNFLWAAQ